MDDAEAIETLGLAQHPEGGWFSETFRDAGSTAIYFLVREGERSHWHRVPQAEVWHHYAGGPLRLLVASSDAGPVDVQVLGTDLAAGQRPQVVVPAGWWQAAEPVAGWVLGGCTVAPPFEFATFELAPDGWSPGSPPNSVQ